PERYRSAFSEAFLSWNRKFQASIGRDMFEFEFLEKNDSRFDLIIAGDIRYNVIEWDLVNLAGYGGLGPSIANQFTGETFDANVLIQGPMIETIYKKWFDVSDKIKELKSLGSNQLAEELKVNFTRELNNKIAKAAGIKHAIRLGKTLSFHISSEDQRNHDPLYEPLNFDTIPEGYTYDSYMEGYFIDMLAHELGHNIGLRHNFRGNLASDDSMKLGSVSRSIMEYLSGKFRHLDRLGDYDSMAISYGYAGVKPTHSDWYCTDEDKADARNPKNSAECSSSDATSDPFSYFEGQLDKSIGLLVGKDSTDEPIWKISDLQRQLTESLEGISNYVISAPFTFESWTNFQGKLDRPNDAFLIPQYVLNRLSSKVCSANFDRIVESKNSDKAKKQTLDNIIALQKFVKTLGQAYKVPLNIFTNDQFPCLADK
ncbi:MAG: zinc-dependent metalloprotease, partial [Bacteriovorax sp.]|nr:zinc-dependent metalloprotease [Bacteriovorax sp.]